MKCGANIIAIFAGCLLQPAGSAQLSQLPDIYNAGRADLDNKNYARAEQEFAAAEAQAPHASNALALRAKALIHLDRYTEAERCLRDFLKLTPQSADATYLLGYVLFRRNLPSESLSVYTRAAQLQRPSADDFKIVGLDYVLLNDYAYAVKWLERAVSEHGTDAETVYYLGRAYYVQNAFEKAIAAFERALELDPQYAKAEDNLGLAYAAKNRLDLAETCYRKAIALGDQTGRRNEDPYINLADLLSHGGHDTEALQLLDTAEQIAGKSDRTEELRGRLYLAEDRLKEAEEEFRAAIALKPQNGSLHYLLGRVLKRQGKTDAAENEFAQTKALLGTHSSEQSENEPGAAEHQAIARARLDAVQKPLDAIGELGDALKVAPGNTEAQTLLREIAKNSALNDMRAGNKEGALAILAKAREALPRDPELLYEFGFVAAGSELFKLAEQPLEEALRLKPEYYDARYALARVYLEENLAARAEEEMRKCVDARPSDASAHYGLGYIFVAEQRLEDAKKEFEKSLTLQPDQTESVFQLGEIALEGGEADLARGYFDKVLTRDSRHAGALTGIGVLSYRARDYDLAKTNLERAIASAPKYQKAHYYYALTLAKQGNKSEADREFEISKSLQKNHGSEYYAVMLQ